MSQPVWKTLYSLGDRGEISIDLSGVYEPEVELWFEYEPEEDECFDSDECECEYTRSQHTVAAGGTGEEIRAGACGEFETDTRNRVRYKVYRFSLDRCSAHKGLFDKHWMIIPYGYHLLSDLQNPIEYYEEWFSKKLDRVAASSDLDHDELVEALCSEDVLERWKAYDAISGYYGPDNFDNYPLDLSEKELADRQESNARRDREREAQLKKHRCQQQAALLTEPHGRCAASEICLEHALDKRVLSCKSNLRKLGNRRGSSKGRKLSE